MGVEGRCVFVGWFEWLNWWCYYIKHTAEKDSVVENVAGE